MVGETKGGKRGKLQADDYEEGEHWGHDGLDATKGWVKSQYRIPKISYLRMRAKTVAATRM